jgi:hypothetical protein
MRRWLLVTLLLVGCASRAPVRPDDLSAADHREEASREREAAAAERARFDPNARAMSRFQVQNMPYLSEYNPTERYLRSAAAHTAHAREHEAAAAALEQFEDDACKPLTPAARAACPVLGPLSGIEDIDGGVRVRLADANALDQTIALMRCHLAYARARAFAVVADCPLYMRGVEIRRTADGGAIELVGGTGDLQDELRRRVREEAVQSRATVL